MASWCTMIRLYTCTRIRARHHLRDDRVYAFTALGVYAYHGTPLCHEENAVFDAYHCVGVHPDTRTLSSWHTRRRLYAHERSPRKAFCDHSRRLNGPGFITIWRCAIRNALSTRIRVDPFTALERHCPEGQGPSRQRYATDCQWAGPRPAEGTTARLAWRPAVSVRQAIWIPPRGRCGCARYGSVRTRTSGALLCAVP